MSKGADGFLSMQQAKCWALFFNTYIISWRQFGHKTTFSCQKTIFTITDSDFVFH